MACEVVTGAVKRYASESSAFSVPSLKTLVYVRCVPRLSVTPVMALAGLALELVAIRIYSTDPAGGVNEAVVSVWALLLTVAGEEASVARAAATSGFVGGNTDNRDTEVCVAIICELFVCDMT